MAKVQKEQLFDGRHGASIMTSRHGMWYFRIWLDTENKYLLRSLKTKNKAEAKIRGEKQFIEVMADSKIISYIPALSFVSPLVLFELNLTSI